LTDLSDLTWTEVGRDWDHSTILAIPLGATEQHGPHLPFSTDSDIATALCERLALARTDVLVAPTLPYGSSGEHQGFPGTLSIGQAALELLVVELGRSAAVSFDHLLFVCAHGGNAEALARAVATLRSEGKNVLLFMPRWKGDPHAGRPETAMMLALRPDRVQMEHAEPGDERPLAQVLTQLRAGGVRAVSTNGILGNPVGADADEGRTLLASLSASLDADVQAWRPVGAK
jgi:mycofactocin system creatininase family protein